MEKWLLTEIEECELVICEIYAEMEQLFKKATDEISEGISSEYHLNNIVDSYLIEINLKKDEYTHYISRLHAYEEAWEERL